MPILESLKQFLKPDWRKILFTVILYLLLFFSLASEVISCYVTIEYPPCPDYLGAFSKSFPILFLIYFFSCLVLFISGSFRQFLKPDKRKITVFVIFIVIFLLSIAYFVKREHYYDCLGFEACEDPHPQTVSGDFLYGIPLKYLIIYRSSDVSMSHYVQGFIIEPLVLNLTDFTAYDEDRRNIEVGFFFALFIDLIFWYLVSCLAISAWDKVKKRK